jgi:hypothetical protein
MARDGLQQGWRRAVLAEEMALYRRPLVCFLAGGVNLAADTAGAQSVQQRQNLITP